VVVRSGGTGGLKSCSFTGTAALCLRSGCTHTWCSILIAGNSRGTFRLRAAEEGADGEKQQGGTAEMVTTDSTGPGVVRLLEKEPTPAERYGHASALMALITKHRPNGAKTGS